MARNYRPIRCFWLVGPYRQHRRIWVPHLRDGFIVDKVGHRAKRDPSLFVRAGISGLDRVRPEDSDG
jgi:hypothetical protein